MPTYLPTTKFLRIGKYLLPGEAFSLDWSGAPRPQRMASFCELQAEFPDMVSSVSQGPVGSFPAASFPVMRDGEYSSVSLPDVSPTENRIYRVREGGSVGRNCCLVGPGNTVITETAFYYDTRHLAETLSFGRFHPHYWRYRWQGDLRCRWRLPKPTRIAGCVAALNNRCAHNFYHWMLEIAPRIAALDMAGIKPDWYLVDCQNRFQKRVLEMLGVPPDKLIQPHCKLFLVADELLSPSDPSPSVLKHFATLLEPKNSNLRPIRKRKLYISRRRAHHRRIENEPAVESLLLERGFESHCFEDYSVDEQFRLMQSAQVVVTTHGAALANSIFCSPGTDVIELFPDRRTNLDLYPRLSRNFGLRHQLVLVQCAKFGQNIRVDLAHLELALDHCAGEEHSAPLRLSRAG